MNNIHIIGVGQMGRAILFGLRRSIIDCHLKPIEVCADRAAYLASCGVEVSKRIESIDDDDVVILAVPPQQFQSVVRDNQLLLSHRGPVISVMAGITTNSLCRTLGHTRIVRSIPNTPSEVQEGVTFYYVQESADSDLITVAEKIFGTIGICMQVDNEWQLDSGTALAGGGPALVAYFANALLLYAESEGFDSKVAWEVSTQLLYGTSLLLKSTRKTPMQLCEEVQTKGGTTERAVQLFDQHDFNGDMLSALTAAAERSKELEAYFLSENRNERRQVD